MLRVEVAPSGQQLYSTQYADDSQQVHGEDVSVISILMLLFLQPKTGLRKTNKKMVVVNYF